MAATASVVGMIRASMSKGELLREYLEQRGARVSSHRLGWQKISCINSAGHSRGDRNPSASVNLTTGRYKCFACDLHGDVYDLLMAESGLSYKQALVTLGGKASQQPEETWF